MHICVYACVFNVLRIWMMQLHMFLFAVASRKLINFAAYIYHKHFLSYVLGSNLSTDFTITNFTNFVYLYCHLHSLSISISHFFTFCTNLSLSHHLFFLNYKALKITCRHLQRNGSLIGSSFRNWLGSNVDFSHWIP